MPAAQLAQLADDVERVAQQVVESERQLTARIDGVRADADVALLQQVNAIVERIERLEGLFAESALRQIKAGDFADVAA